MLHTESSPRHKETGRPPGWARSLSRLLALLAIALVAIAAVGAPAGAAPAAAPSVQVFVGYADTLRANPSNFPTPWYGSSNVVFAGCQTGCTFDAGAARFVNNTPVAVTIDSVRIRLSTCTFDMWPHSTVLQPGQQFIVTQTASGAADGCVNGTGFFDTSDIGPNGVGWSGHCNQSGVIPQVDVTIDGVLQTFADSGQVLNTGGVDKAVCPSGSNNESNQWTLVGDLPCPGATLSLAPATQTLSIGSTATVQGTLRNSCGTGLQGAPITFTVQSGPHAGKTGTATTGVNGVASFSYAGTGIGTDTLLATTTNPAGTITSNTATVTWQKKASQLTITAGATSDFNDPATVSGTLSDSLGPLAGEAVTFSLNGSESCSATTNASGVASCSLTPHEAAGSYPLSASFAGDATHTGTSANGTFVVKLEETTLAYTGPTKAANGQPLTVSGVLKEDGTAPIAGRPVAFTIGSGASAQSCSATTNASGQASCTIAVAQPASATTLPLSATFAGDAFYKPATAAATLRFQYLTGRAFGLKSGGLVGISPTPDTGPVSTAAATTVAPPCVLTLSGLVVAHTLCAKVVTTVNPGTSTATASLQDARIGVLGLPVIQVGLVQSSSQTACSGSTGQVTITSITVGGVPVNIALHPGPNTTITVLGITLVLNEQIPVAGADQGLTVNAVHISALGLLDVVIASSTSDIHNC